MAESSDALAGCVGKVNRAKLHLSSLDREFGSFVNSESKPWGFISRVDPETGRYSLRVRRHRSIPMELSLIVGDFSQNLRAALDHLVWQLVIVNGKRKPSGNYFPILDERPEPGSREHKGWKRATKGLSGKMVAFIDACQPYHRVESGVHVLTGLRNLSNQDKHRVIVNSHAAIRRPAEGFGFDIESRRDVGEILNGKLVIEAAMDDGDEVAWADAEVTGPNPEVKLKAELPIEIGFGDIGWITPLRALEEMMNGVATVIQEACDLWFDGKPLWPQDEAS